MIKDHIIKNHIINILKLDIEWTICVANRTYINSIIPLSLYDLSCYDEIIDLETNIVCRIFINKYGEIDLKIFINKENIKDVVRLIGGIHKIININNILKASSIIKELPLEFM